MSDSPSTSPPGPEGPRAGEPRERAVPALVDRYGGRLYHLGLRFCGNAAEAEDLVQETFLSAWRSWDEFEGRSSPSTWLFRIAARACGRMHRPRSGEPARVDSLETPLPFGETLASIVPDDEAGPMTETARREALENLQEAVAALPDDFRRPLVLKEIAGFSLREVGEILDLDPATVKTRLHRARLRVRDALESVLPKEPLPPPRFSREVCLDLLQAKQEALDKGLTFAFPGGVVCDRCEAFFGTLDLARDLCGELADGPLPAPVREALEARLAGIGEKS